MKRLDAYVDGVLSGRIVAGRYVRQAAERHRRDIERAAAGWDYHFDRAEGQFAVDFIETLRHSKGQWAGQPLRLSDWQVFVIGSLFGWKHCGENRRRFRFGYVEVARKNGKSTLSAGIGHKLFVADGEAGAEVYTAATKLAQAKIVHDEAKRMVKKSPGLRKIVTVLRDNLFCEATASKYQPLGADGGTEDGLNVHGAIVDELHAHKNRELWDVLETATGARTQPLIVAITTAGDGNNRNTICWELRSYVVKILEGRVQDDAWFGAIYCLDEAQYDAEGHETTPADDWTKEENWPKANPNIGVSVQIDDLRVKARKAIETPSAAPNFRRKHLDQWVSYLSDWLPAGLWDANAGPEIWYGPEGLLPAIRERYRGLPCWVGGDLSAVDDLTSLVFAFKIGEELHLFPRVWCPRQTAIERAGSRQVPYLIWADAGQLELTEGNSVDYDAVRQCLKSVRKEWGWDVRQVGFDPHNARYLATQLAEQDGFEVVEFRQGFLSMNEPIKQLTRKLKNRRVRHGGHRPLAWSVSNVVTRSDAAGNLKFDKEKSAEKIDPAVATVMATGLALAAKDQPSFEHTGGIRIL